MCLPVSTYEDVGEGESLLYFASYHLRQSQLRNLRNTPTHP